MQSPVSRQITIIVPVLNEIERVKTLLAHLSKYAAPVILVDGGSTDGTLRVLDGRRHEHLRVLSSAPGRGVQMNAGARAAQSGVLLFLHADTLLPANTMALIEHALTARSWGRFDVRFDADHVLLRVIAWFMNRRSAWSGICTGDQGLFMTRDAFESVGGFPQIELMEDIEISKRLKRLCPPARVTATVTTSARRWLQHGILRTVLTMWWLRFRYWCGAHPASLSRRYHEPD